MITELTAPLVFPVGREKRAVEQGDVARSYMLHAPEALYRTLYS